MASDKDKEEVLCISAKHMDAVLGEGFHGFGPCSLKRLLAEDDQIQYVPRGECETDPSLKQIIPYIFFQHYSAGEKPSSENLGQILRFVRTKSGGEERLYGKHSIGFGGHIVKSDEENCPAAPASGIAAFWGGFHRELREELIIDSPPYTVQAGDVVLADMRHVVVGAIYDSSNEVGQVHLGLAVCCDVPVPAIYPNEPAVSRLHWCDGKQLQNNDLHMFENWSQILISNLQPWCVCNPASPLVADLLRMG